MAGRLLLLTALVPYAVWLVFAYSWHFLDGANLLFHEAGHVFFGFLGRTLGMLGGTLGQFVFPIATGLHFLRQERPFEACVSLLWLGETLMYTAVYMADAKARALPLVGGEIHDWHWLLSRWGLLRHCEGLGSVTHALGSGIVLGALALAAGCLMREWRSRTPGARSIDAASGPEARDLRRA
jgi:hypothetical protein